MSPPGIDRRPQNCNLWHIWSTFQVLIFTTPAGSSPCAFSRKKNSFLAFLPTENLRSDNFVTIYGLIASLANLIEVSCNCQHTLLTNRKRWSLKWIAVKLQLRQRRQLAEALRQRRQLVIMPSGQRARCSGSVRHAAEHTRHTRASGLRALCSLISMHRLQNATQRHVPAHTFAQALRRDSCSFVSAVSWPKLSGSAVSWF